MWAAITIIAGIAALVYMAGCWWREDYEGENDEVIVKHWGGENDDKYEVRYVPMYRNKWGKIYYGEFQADFHGGWRHVKYMRGFGDGDVFTRRQIYHHYLYSDDWIGRQIARQEKRSQKAKQQASAIKNSE